MCSTMDRKEKVMQPKWDTLKKHEGRRKALINMPKCKGKKGEWYMAKNQSTRKNLVLFNVRFPNTLLQLMNHFIRLKKDKKKVQFAILLQVLLERRPMVKYENQATLY